ncbi:hypothetical protein B0H19DRAFT_1167504 [Mycena capillaripes]|nr:hypothetical protein B0H19DRAFT_1167504 [Mycena capillaripes]
MHHTSLTSRFPQELIDCIIEGGRLRLFDLRSCSLVCRAFVRPSQARIFYHLECSLLSESAPSFQRLFDILSESPHLIRHIRSLRLHLDGHPMPSALSSVLNLLSNLREFKLKHVSWAALSHDAQAAICDLCRRSDLSRLRLYDIREISSETLSRLVDSPKLTDLSLYEVKLSSPKNITSSPLHNQMRLTRLVLITEEDCDLFVAWLAQAGSLSHLQHLTCSCDAREMSSLQGVISASATSLQDVIIVASPEFPLSQSLSLAPITSLRSLTVYISLGASHGLVEFLQSHTSPRTLRTIRLYIDPTDGEAGLTDWERLARLLEGDRFPALRKLEVIFYDHRGSPELLQTIVTQANHGFAKLETKGVFKCKVEDLLIPA